MMTKRKRKLQVFAFLFLLVLNGVVFGQNMNNANVYSKTINSKIIGEERTILIHTPEGYLQTKASYPVFYQLDGDKDQLSNTLNVLKGVSTENKNIPGMIVVEVKNVNRSRDMWPTHTMYYPESEPLGAGNFLGFIEEELIPFVDSHYRTNNNRILCGQSLSAVFTLYAFLNRPGLFNSYIACSGAFPDCEVFFNDLAEKVFMNDSLFHKQNLFISHGLKDPLDTDGVVHKQMTDFKNTINDKLGNKVNCKYVFYENEGHVPKNSLRDGLLFLFE